jgi:Tol biopolymer transport system component
MVLGTVGYMAPEQVRGQQADHRADIFAFGAVLYEMLTGERAFAGDSAIETMSTILKADPMDSPSASVHVSGAIEPLLRHCLEKQPDERFQSARDLAFQLQAVASGSLSTGSAAALGAGNSRTRPIAISAAIGLAALIAGILIGRTLLAPSVSTTEPVMTSVVLPDDITFFAGVSPSRSGGLAVSPDGRTIAFVARGAEGQRIFIRALDSERAIPVAGTEGGNYPVWSPDGTRLAFITLQGLMQLPAAGGTAQLVTPISNSRSAPAWGPDDAFLFHSDYRGPLLRVAATGGTPVEVLKVPGGQESWFSPVWLDARRFLVTRFHYHDRDEGSGIYSGSIDSKDVKLVLAGRISEIAIGDGELYYRRGIDLVAQRFDPASATVSGDPRVLSDRVSMVSAARRTLVYYAPPGALSSGQRVVWLSRAGQEIGQIAPAGNYRDPRFSPDGRQLAVARANDSGLFEIWAYDLARGIDTRVTGSTFISPSWSSDGQSILAGGNASLHRFRVGENATPERLPFTFPGSAFVMMADMAVDGRSALIRLTSDSGDVQQSLILLDGSNSVRALGPPYRSTAVTPVLSPNSEWAITTALVRGTRRLQAQRVDGTGAIIPVAGIQGDFPRFGKDGRELYFLSRATGVQQMMVVAVSWPGGVPDFGVPQKLFDAPTLFAANLGFDVSADGQRFVAVVQSNPKPTPLTVVLPAAFGR